MRLFDRSTKFISTVAVGFMWVCPSTMGFIHHPKSCLPSLVTRLDMATWSDSKAVRDYQDFLSSGRQEPEKKPDIPSVIVVSSDEGSKEMGNAIARMGMGDDLILNPNQDPPKSLDGNTEYPIYIAVLPYELETFIKELSWSYKERAEDFVFLSGGLRYGNVEDVLKDRGYCRDSMTQLLVSGFEITPLGTVNDISVRLGLDASGEDKWAGECAACGKWKSAIAERLERSNVRCCIDFYREWRRRMWERSVFDAIFNLVGAVREEETTLADVANYYENEVGDMIWETSGCLRGWKALTLTFGFEERLYGIGESLNTDKHQCVLLDQMYPYIWGNRVFTESKTIKQYLWYARETKGLLQSVDLPPKPPEGAADTPSIIRKGNLRADGVV